jgi:hypothetical protein
MDNFLKRARDRSGGQGLTFSFFPILAALSNKLFAGNFGSQAHLLLLHFKKYAL